MHVRSGPLKRKLSPSFEHGHANEYKSYENILYIVLTDGREGGMGGWRGDYLEDRCGHYYAKGK